VKAQKARLMSGVLMTPENREMWKGLKTDLGEYLIYYLDGSEDVMKEAVQKVVEEEKTETLISSFADQYQIKKIN
jgi:hypothetical protein